VVLEAIAEPSEPAESGASLGANPRSTGSDGDRRPSATARQPATAFRRRKSSEAGRAAAAAGGFTEPLRQGKAAPGRRAYLPAALIDEEPEP
jgi:hypothetical protein